MKDKIMKDKIMKDKIMKDKIIGKTNILGQDYKLLIGDSKQYPNLDGANAYTDLYAKKIVMDTAYATDEGNFKSENPDKAINKLYRHEIVHAFISESAFGYNMSSEEEEQLVNWITEQFPKMKKVFEELNVED